jgi:Domain of unknown function (DUF4249)
MFMRRLLLIATLLAVGCSENNTAFNPALVNELVVDGCLVAGSSIDSIHLSPLMPYGGSDSSLKQVTGAVVTVSDGISTHALSAFGDSGYYRCPDSTFVPQAGTTYSISIGYNGQNVSASTVVPEQPAGLTLSADTIFIDTAISTMEQMRSQYSGGTVPGIKLTFKNPNSAYFYAVVQNVDSAPVALNQDTLMFRGSRFLSSPFKDTSYVVSFAQIKMLGRHKITLYRVNQEYVDLYDNRTQSSQNLNEPKTNIMNGLGIFTAVNCDSIFFYAAAE